MLFRNKILMPHQYFYPHMDLIEDRCRAEEREQFLRELCRKPGRSGDSESELRRRRAMIYIHVPYCDSKCNFCGFDKQYNLLDMDEYVDRLIRELEFYSSERFIVDGVHFGGGTPTLLSGAQLRRILHTVRRCFELTPDASVNMEGSCTSLYREDVIQFILDEKITRVSTGIQTFHSELREVFNQKSTLDQVYHTLETLKKHHIVVHGDILYGYPEFPIGNEEDMVISDIAEAIRMGLDGIDFSPVFPYSNNLEWISRQQHLTLPDTESMLRMMRKGGNLMEQAGYRRETCYCYIRQGKILMESNYYGGIDDIPDCIAVGSGALGNICGYKYRNYSFNPYMHYDLPGYAQLKRMTAAERENIAVVGWPKLFTLSRHLIRHTVWERFGSVLEFLRAHGAVTEDREGYHLTEEAKDYADNIYYLMLPEKEKRIAREQLKIVVYGGNDGDILWDTEAAV